MIGPTIAISAVLLVCGLLCMATKRNAIAVLMGVELVLNAANLNFVCLSQRADIGIDGQAIALFIIVIAAAEAAVALAIALAFYNSHRSIDIDDATVLHG